jgi:hypothetical protein
MPSTISGRKAANAAKTSIETAMRTRLGTGARLSARPVFVMTTRPRLNRSRCREPARTTDGPPPSTDGSR